MTTHRILPAATTLHGAPDADSEAVSELLHGEQVSLLDASTCGRWQRVRNHRDGYTGWLTAAALEASRSAPTHWVVRRATLVFAKPDIKSRVVRRIGFCAQLAAGDAVNASSDETFLTLDDGTCVFREHVLPLSGRLALPPVEIAETRALDAPYRWGGRSSDGCDCSGLVQACHFATGLMLPRDSGQQEQALAALAAAGLGLAALASLPAYSALPVHNDATVTALDDSASPARGDLLYWPGHVALMTSATHILHATAHSLNTLIEPLAAIVSRVGDPRSRFRLA